MDFLKDPQAVLDFKWDWKASTNGTGDSDWLATGEVITEFTVTADTGIVVDSSVLVDDGTAVVAWLSGGAANKRYGVTCHITTSDGRQDDRKIRVFVTER